MIREIRVTSLALIDDLTVEFGAGFTVFTGETGAGKSILMDAVGLLAGERAFSEQVRSGAEEAEVSGLFEVAASSPAAHLLHEQGISCQDGAMVVRRRIQREGRNRVHINDTPVSLGLLKQVGDLLVDLHGQHDHQSLLHEHTARLVVDSLPEVEPSAGTYCAAWDQFAQAQARLTEHDREAARLRERRDVLEFQRKELESLGLRAGEEALLETELALLSSSTERAACAGELTALLRGEDSSVEARVSAVRKRLQSLARLDPQVRPWLDELESARTTLNELSSFCESYLEGVNERADPGRVEKVNDRLARVQRLKKKYGCSADELATRLVAVVKDLASIDNSDADRQQLAARLETSRARCAEAAAALRTAREKALKPFDRAVTRQMSQVGFTGAAWQTALTPLDMPGPHGSETVQFTVRTNPGEPFLPLARTAAGGEISRLMLAVKSVLAAHDRVPVLVFDEIDTGIGGTVAHEIGRCLRSLSSSHQVLCISHLHQIAALGDTHYQVSKQVEGKRTVTRVRRLTPDERVDEVARMLGGVSEMTRTHARELLRSRDAVHGTQDRE